MANMDLPNLKPNTTMSLRRVSTTVVQGTVLTDYIIPGQRALRRLAAQATSRKHMH